MRAAEHCPVCILQARGGGAIPELALSTTERFVRLLTGPAMELPKSLRWPLSHGGGAGGSAATGLKPGLTLYGVYMVAVLKSLW